MGQQPMRRYDPAAAANELSGDIVAIIFGFFPPEDIMRMRCVCKKWREAAKRTIVPMAGFSVDSVNKYNAVVAMATALPNLQQLSMCDPGNLHKYSDGEDQYEYMADYMAHYTAHDINIISNFRKLRCLGIHDAPLNGRYPVLFNFPLLRELRVTTSDGLKFDLGMLSGLPLLKELKLIDNDQLVGNLGSLRVLKDTLEKVEISCHFIEGNFMDLADFPRLKKLNLRHTSVTGDVRDIGENDFPALESLVLPRTVCGGVGYEFQLISEVPSFMQAIYLLLQRTPTLFEKKLLRRTFHWRLSEHSPSWYEDDNIYGCPQPPFSLQIIQVGSRRGWSWCSYDDHSCEINWLDPEPSRESSGYKAYVEKLQGSEWNVGFYRGYSQPPTLAEYNRLCDEYMW